MSANVTLFGNAGNVGELRTTPSGSPVLKFGLADKKNGRDLTWYNVTVWGKRAEWAAEYLKKGEKCHVVGELELRPYTTKDGETRISADVEARVLDIAWVKYNNDRDQRDERAGERPKPSKPSRFNDADIPF